MLIPTMIVVWMQDFHSPLYIASRVGEGERLFKMVKLRSMVVNADRSGVMSTSAADRRVTVVGRFIRRYKLDELTQLWNVLIGDMSLVGPRPNVKAETDLYTAVERELLNVKPGITDFASIIFSDEGEILKGQSDPDLAYNQLIRPWKSRLGLFYIEHRSLLVDFKLVFLTALAVLDRSAALRGVQSLLAELGAAPELVYIAGRTEPLVPSVPPGATDVVRVRAAA